MTTPCDAYAHNNLQVYLTSEKGFYITLEKLYFLVSFWSHTIEDFQLLEKGFQEWIFVWERIQVMVLHIDTYIHMYSQQWIWLDYDTSPEINVFKRGSKNISLNRGNLLTFIFIIPIIYIVANKMIMRL